MPVGQEVSFTLFIIYYFTQDQELDLLGSRPSRRAHCLNIYVCGIFTSAATLNVCMDGVDRSFHQESRLGHGVMVVDANRSHVLCQSCNLGLFGSCSRIFLLLDSRF